MGCGAAFEGFIHESFARPAPVEDSAPWAASGQQHARVHIQRKTVRIPTGLTREQQFMQAAANAVRRNKQINCVARGEAARGPFCWASVSSSGYQAPAGGEGRDARRRTAGSCSRRRIAPQQASPSGPARRHRARLVRAIMEHFKRHGIKKRAELSPPRASAVP